MTPAARVAAAIDCLDEILAGAPAERVLTNWARASRFAGSKDRAALRDHVFGALRCRASFAHLGGALTGRGLMIGACRANGDAPEDIFTGEGHAPSPLTPDELVPAKGTPPQDVPAWALEMWSAELGAGEAARIAELYRERAPIGLRLRGDIPALAAELAADGLDLRKGAGPAGAYLAEGHARRLRGTKAYASGAVELQDIGAQELCAALPLKDGDHVLDYCAGGGGKILALADQARIKAFAHDIAPARMADLPARAARAGRRVTCLEGRALPEHGPFDLVLCDAPCSGSGTWRRSPQSKWAFSQAQLDELTRTQLGILEKASPLVAAKGRLAYATCSIFDAENARVIAAFLARHPDWACISQHLRLPDAEGDGFFSAQLQRC